MKDVKTQDPMDIIRQIEERTIPLINKRAEEMKRSLEDFGSIIKKQKTLPTKTKQVI
jgi:hypothetical protein